MSEVWKPVLNNKYEVSNTGEVRHHKNKNKLKKKTAGRNRAYYQICFNNNGNNAYRYIHRLVCEGFFGKIPDGFVVNHKDGNKRNNNVENLEIVLPRQNYDHAIKNRLYRSGSNSPVSKLDDNQVVEIRILLMSKMFSQKEIAKKYGINQSAISLINVGKNWKYL